MILITGATGHLGKATIDFLLKKGISANNIAALVRDEAKAADLKALGITLRKGDYHDYASLETAFQGIDKLLLISSSDMNDRTTQQLNVVKAAKATGVKHILYTSFQHQNGVVSSIPFIAQPHLDTEKAVKESGLAFTILKNTLYIDILPMFFGEKVLETGIFLPAGNGKVAYATRSEMAEAIAQILATDEHENKIYELTGNTAYNLHDMAAILSELSGKTVIYKDAPAEVYTDVMTKAGVPADAIGFLAAFSGAIKNNEFDLADDTLEKLIGRATMAPKEYFSSVYFAN